MNPNVSSLKISIKLTNLYIYQQRKKEKIQILKVKHEREYITTNFTETQSTIWEHYEQLNAN